MSVFVSPTRLLPALSRPRLKRFASLAGVGRVAGIGGGADLFAELSADVPDVVYPPFLNGSWTCLRQVAAVEGGDFFVTVRGRMKF